MPSLQRHVTCKCEYCVQIEATRSEIGQMGSPLLRRLPIQSNNAIFLISEY